MADLLIRDVPDDVVSAVDAEARRLGLSRSEYLRRKLAQEVTPATRKMTVRDFEDFARTFADLKDPDVMARAWE